LTCAKFFFHKFLGPLTAFIKGKVVVVGISSFVGGNCTLGIPNVFSRVTFQKSWILSNTDAAKYQCMDVRGTTNKKISKYKNIKILKQTTFFESDYIEATTSSVPKGMSVPFPRKEKYTKLNRFRHRQSLKNLIHLFLGTEEVIFFKITIEQM